MRDDFILAISVIFTATFLLGAITDRPLWPLRMIGYIASLIFHELKKGWDTATKNYEFFSRKDQDNV